MKQLKQILGKVKKNFEWSCRNYVYNNSVKVFGVPEIGLLASSTNFEIKNYFSYNPDPHAISVDVLPFKVD